MPQAIKKPELISKRARRNAASEPVTAPPVPKEETGLQRLVAPLGLASPQLRARIVQKLSGIILAMAFPIGLASAWFWSFLHEPDLPLPFHVMVDQNALLPPARNAAAEIAPLNLNMQDQAPVAGLAKDPRLIENSIHGAVPRISADGLKSRQVYARPFVDSSNRPRITIIVTGLGLGLAVTDRAIAALPPAITLAFSPYGQDLVRQVQLARQSNRELLLQIPMEPFDFPANDGGPAMLMADAPADTNQDRLLWSLARMSGYVGLTNLQGGRFRASPAMARFLEQAERRGLIYIDDNPASSARRGAVALDPLTLDGGLAELEKQASAQGQAIGIVPVTPVLIDRLMVWAKDLETRGIVLAPLTATLDRAAR